MAIHANLAVLAHQKKPSTWDARFAQITVQNAFESAPYVTHPQECVVVHDQQVWPSTCGTLLDNSFMSRSSPLCRVATGERIRNLEVLAVWVSPAAIVVSSSLA
jgi:hypothetical protein